MVNSVSFDAGGGQSIALIQTGPNTVTMVENGQTIYLANIVLTTAGLSCDVLGAPVFMKPHIDVSWSHDDLKITISRSWVKDGSTDYQISDKSMLAFQHFIIAGRFAHG